MEKSIRKDIFCRADSAEVQQAFSVINRSMDFKIDSGLWHWLKNANSDEPVMFVAKKADSVVGTVIMYPCVMRVRAGLYQKEAFAGQLCIAEAYQRKGLAFGLLTSAMESMSDQGISFYSVTSGIGIYKHYYRKQLGFCKTLANFSQFNFSDYKVYVEEFCRKVNAHGFTFHEKLTIKIRDPVFDECSLVFHGSEAMIAEDSAIASDLSLEGPTWVIFRYLVHKKGKKLLTKTLLSFRVRLKGFFHHPIKYVFFIKFLYKVAKK